MAEDRWYKLDVNGVFSSLSTWREGLTTPEAESRLKKYGYNKLEEKGGPSPVLILLSQFKNPLIYILLAAGLLTLALGLKHLYLIGFKLHIKWTKCYVIK